MPIELYTQHGSVKAMTFTSAQSDELVVRSGLGGMFDIPILTLLRRLWGPNFWVISGRFFANGHKLLGGLKQKDLQPKTARSPVVTPTCYQRDELD